MDIQQRNSFLTSLAVYDNTNSPLDDGLAAAYSSYSKENQKKPRESALFMHFVQASGLCVDPLDHTNEDPPFPDIRTTIGGRPWYFEFSEITHSELAAAVRSSIESGTSRASFSSPEGPVIATPIQKCQKSYLLKGENADLVLYYGINQPTPRRDLLLHSLQKNLELIKTAAKESQFSRIWVFSDRQPRRILWSCETCTFLPIACRVPADP